MTILPENGKPIAEIDGYGWPAAEVSPQIERTQDCIFSNKQRERETADEAVYRSQQWAEPGSEGAWTFRQYLARMVKNRSTRALLRKNQIHEGDIHAAAEAIRLEYCLGDEDLEVDMQIKECEVEIVLGYSDEAHTQLDIWCPLADKEDPIDAGQSSLEDHLMEDFLLEEVTKEEGE